MQDNWESLVETAPMVPNTAMEVHQKAVTVLNYAKALIVNGREPATQATNDLAIIKTLGEELDKSRRELVDPLNAQVKTVNDAFRTLRAPLDEATTLLKGKLSDYDIAQRQAKARADEALRAHQAAQEAAAALEQTTGELTEVPEAKPMPSGTPLGNVYGATGDTHWREVWHCEVEDESLIPRDFMVPSRKLLLAAMSAGRREIPGLKIWSTNEPIVRRRG